MITKLRISNYRSLGPNVEIDLGPLTAFVGANGSGKSNIADSLRFIEDCMRIGLEGAITKRHGVGAVRRWSAGRPFNVSFQITFRDQESHGIYRFDLGGDRAAEYKVLQEEARIFVGEEVHGYKLVGGEWERRLEGASPRVDPFNLVLPLMAGDERFRPLAEMLRNMRFYSIFPDVLREPQKFDPARPMEETGANWVSILRDPSAVHWKPDLVAALARLTGNIRDLDVKQAGGYLLARFKHQTRQKHSKWFDAVQESDGTLRVAGIVTALLQQGPLPLIGIEEPELTVHPGAIPLIYDLLREAADSRQVLVTTHSPDLLDLFDVDEVRVVQQKDGVTKVGSLERQQRDIVRDHLMSLGEVLRTEGLRQQELPF